MEAFILLNLPNASLTVGNNAHTGTLSLECVTVQAGHFLDRKAVPNHDVFLVLRVDAFETPLDSSGTIRCSVANGTRRYLLLSGTEEQVTIHFREPGPQEQETRLREDLETFDNILSQYAEFKGPQSSSLPLRVSSHRSINIDNKEEDLRGHVVLIDEDNGEIVGELENAFVVEKDPVRDSKAGEEEHVVIELRKEDGEPDEDPRAVFVRALPAGHENYITNSASLVSYAISGTTSLLTSAITFASSYYIKNSEPHPYASASTSKSSADVPPPQPPRALVLLTSERTRNGLAMMHTMSGQVARVSAKTAKSIGVLQGKITRAVVEKATDVYAQMNASTLAPPLPPRSPDPSPVQSRSSTPEPIIPSPPPYTTYTPRHPPALPPRPPSVPTADRDPNAPPTNNLQRLRVSADLILSTIDTSAKQIVDVGSQQLGAVMGHKYGPEAEHSTNLLTGTARNVVLVFIDVKGVGRRALIKNTGKMAGKELVKTRRKVVAAKTPLFGEKQAVEV